MFPQVVLVLPKYSVQSGGVYGQAHVSVCVNCVSLDPSARDSVDQIHMKRIATKYI